MQQDGDEDEGADLRVYLRRGSDRDAVKERVNEQASDGTRRTAASRV